MNNEQAALIAAASMAVHKDHIQTVASVKQRAEELLGWLREKEAEERARKIDSGWPPAPKVT